MPTTPPAFSLEQALQQRLDLLDAVRAKSDATSNYAETFETARPRLQEINLRSVSETTAATPSIHGVFPQSGLADISITQSHPIQSGGQTIWLSGSSLLCQCPDCRAPMTIRLWLRLADCWRCPTSLTLTEEQAAAAEQLVQQNTAQPASAPQRTTLPAPPPPPIDRAQLPPPPPPPVSEPFETEDLPMPSSLVARERELERLSRGSSLARMMRNGVSSVPAWLVSFLLHLAVILILALIILVDPSQLSESITLSTFLGSEDQTGGDIRIEDPTNSLRDDLELSSPMEIGDKELRDVLHKANVDAQQLQVDPRPLVPLPDLSKVKQNITTSRGPLMSFSARDPRVRSEMVRKQGGTTITEAAVSRGLRWLASVQNPDGGWGLKDYTKSRSSDELESDTMATALALLPFLGAGQTQEFGTYKETVARGLAWLLKVQKSNGDLRGKDTGNPGMYAHGQATIVLCEALALTGDQQFIDPAQRAIKFIEAAQHGKGGWRYQPGDPGDTSVFGWQMMALQSARASNGLIEIDEATVKLADYFLDLVTAEARFDNRRQTRLPTGAAYSYLPGREATPSMTAEAILCRMYLGWTKNDPRLDAAVKWLITDHLPSRRDPNLYYWYYGTQVMHHYGGNAWEKWNERTRSLLISTQQTGGRYPGSWTPGDFEWGSRGGRIYTTSLAVCTLEVYYRHLPIFHQIELDR